MTLWRVLRGVPVIAYALTLGALIVSVHLLGDVKRERAAHERGRQSVFHAARVDSVLAAMTAKAHDGAVARTDTVVRVVTERVQVVKTVRVPDTVRVLFPVVDTLVVEARGLAFAVDTLVMRIDVERAAARMRLDVADANAHAARVIVVAQRDTITELKRRPTKKAAAVVGAVGAVAGFLFGVLK